MTTYVRGRDIREGDGYFFLGGLRRVIKVTPRFHSVELHFEDLATTHQLGDQDWVHVDREEAP